MTIKRIFVSAGLAFVGLGAVSQAHAFYFISDQVGDAITYFYTQLPSATEMLTF
jgi:hypothetical protein